MSNNQIKRTVNLEKLVSHPESLKLLILHTPFHLEISTLGKCINLIKLDLSKNNLESFPFLGNLANLKFMFLHQNKLQFENLKRIFFSENNPEYSPLARNIVWVTFWGNSNSFLARHFLANKTSAVAIDNHMVLLEEKKQAPVSYLSIEPFSEKTNVSFIHESREPLDKNASEQAYMQEFWQQMSILRRQTQEVCPIIKIQKVFRGYALRKKIQKSLNEKNSKLNTQRSVFNAWKVYCKRRIKLYYFLQGREKEHYLLGQSQKKRVDLIKRTIFLAREAKARVKARKATLSKPLKFYTVLEGNFSKFQCLYKELNIEKSGYLLIRQQFEKIFRANVSVFIETLFGENAYTIKPNQTYSVRQVYRSPIDHEFGRMVHFGMTSYILKANKMEPIPNSKIVNLKNNCCIIRGSQLLQRSSIDKKIHFSKKQWLNIRKIGKNLCTGEKLQLEEFFVVKAPHYVLQNIVRAVFYINTGAIKVYPSLQAEKISLISEGNLKKLWAVVKIQKIWRGSVFRKHNKQRIQSALKLRKAAVKIQRWIRKEPFRKKWQFRLQAERQLKKFDSKCFYIESSAYFRFILQAENEESLIGEEGHSQFEEQPRNMKMRFINQICSVFVDPAKKNLALFWDLKSRNVQYRQTLRNCSENEINPFERDFLKRCLRCSDQEVSRYLYDSKGMSQVRLSHLFHFNTLTSHVHKKGGKYVRIECNTVQEARFRVLVILLKNFSFTKGITIKFLDEAIFCNPQKRVDIMNKESIFIAVGNLKMKEVSSISKVLFSSKIFLTRPENFDNLSLRSNKLPKNNSEKHEQTFSILIPKVSLKTPQSPEMDDKANNKATEKPKLTIESVKFETEPKEQLQKHSLSVSSSHNGKHLNRSFSGKSQRSLDMSRRVYPQKREIRSYQARVKLKRKEPSFILDNAVHSQQRLSTEPDSRTYERHKSNIEFESEVPAIAEENDRPTKYSSIRQKMKAEFIYRKRVARNTTKKEDSSFHGQFVNVNNFLQQQSLAEYRRRIKTEFQNTNYESVGRVKQQFQKSKERIDRERMSRNRRIIESSKAEKEQIQKRKIALSEKEEQLRQTHSMERREKMSATNQSKGNVKRLKVSFAEECFPILNRTAKTNSQKNIAQKRLADLTHSKESQRAPQRFKTEY